MTNTKNKNKIELGEVMEEEKNELTPIAEIRRNIFDKEEKQEIVEVKEQDRNGELVNNMFNQAIAHEVATNEELKQKVLDTAQKYTNTKMETIKTNVDTEFKEANFNNKKDACESYGFNEKTTPIWATNLMQFFYNIMLAIWLVVGSFTYMPIIFITKKISVGLKKTWIAIIFAIIIYFCATLMPILLALLK